MNLGPRFMSPGWPAFAGHDSMGVRRKFLDMTDLFGAAGLEKDAPRPLADRLRPKTLGEVVGQDHLLSPEGPLGRMIAAGRPASIILWGPPGTGKTTIARLLSTVFKRHFEQLSAVFTGVADLKKTFEAARLRR